MSLSQASLAGGRFIWVQAFDFAPGRVVFLMIQSAAELPFMGTPMGGLYQTNTIVGQRHLEMPISSFDNKFGTGRGLTTSGGKGESYVFIS